MKQRIGRKGEFGLMSGQRCVRPQRVRSYSESRAPSSLHVVWAELMPSMSPELMEMGPARH